MKIIVERYKAFLLGFGIKNREIDENLTVINANTTGTTGKREKIGNIQLKKLSNIYKIAAKDLTKMWKIIPHILGGTKCT